MIKVDHLTKHYGHRAAVQDISFAIDTGEVVGFLGPNGAGKSTTMNILTGYISSTSGDVNINGYDVLENPNEVKKSIGYLPELPPLYTNMTVAEYLNFVYDLKKVSSKKKNKEEHIAKICDMVQINEVKARLISNLSKGYKQRVGLAQALIGDPEVLILDEPTVGLDPQQIIEIRNLIRELGKSHTIILSSHILSEIQSICDRIIIINQGRIVADDTEDNLALSLSNTVEYSVRLLADKEQAQELLSQLDNIDEITFEGSKEENTVDFKIIPAESQDIRKNIFELMSKNNLPIIELSSNRLTLEDVFLKLLAQDQTDSDEEDTDENDENTNVEPEDDLDEDTPDEDNKVLSEENEPEEDASNNSNNKNKTSGIKIISHDEEQNEDKTDDDGGEQ